MYILKLTVFAVDFLNLTFDLFFKNKPKFKKNISVGLT